MNSFTSIYLKFQTARFNQQHWTVDFRHELGHRFRYHFERIDVIACILRFINLIVWLSNGLRKKPICKRWNFLIGYIMQYNNMISIVLVMHGYDYNYSWIPIMNLKWNYSSSYGPSIDITTWCKWYVRDTGRHADIQTDRRLIIKYEKRWSILNIEDTKIDCLRGLRSPA